MLTKAQGAESEESGLPGRLDEVRIARAANKTENREASLLQRHIVILRQRLVLLGSEEMDK